MQNTIDRPALEVVHFPSKGRGVVARRSFSAGETVDTVPVLVLPAEQWPHVEKTELFNYTYGWGPNLEHAALALGYGSLYNHSYRPNARYIRNLGELTIDFVALRNIEEGEEVTVNYNGDPTDTSPVWFEVQS
jgi:SET domain-containing protein